MSLRLADGAARLAEGPPPPDLLGPGAGIRPITEAEYARFQTLIEREAGIHLGPAKTALLVGRLTRRLRELGVRSFGEYYRLVEEQGEPEMTRLLDAICTNETQFFREPRHFEFLEREVLRAWEAEAAAGRRPKEVRAWSAACSTGEEPYSLAMVLLARLPPSSGWAVEVLATDLSTRALERARAGLWPIEKAAKIPERHLKTFMLRGVGARQGTMKAGPEIRAAVRFHRVNLNAPTFGVTGPFDLVFCRNVLIYFGFDRKARVIDRLLDHLAPGGFLFVGHAESLSGLSDRVVNVEPTIYVKAGPGRPNPARRAR